MSDEHLRPPQEHIAHALRVERRVKPNQMALYRECIGDKLMSERTTPRELRDGCILVGVFERCRK